MARPNRLSGLRGQRIVLSRGLGQDSSAVWNTIDTAITTAGQVASVALKPPTYSSVVNPYTGAQTVTSYGSAPAASSFGSSLGLTGTDPISQLLSSPMVWLLGIGLIAAFALKK